ncbi:MAG: DUF1461 domain-containing protein [Alcanivoracaceae bacterium]|nr:DUF1461 domain-containing protein [Alcanivoracaceae bacterium]
MNKQSTEYHAARAFAWLLYVIAAIWLAISASWWAFSRADYGYPFWYEQMAISQHIDTYAPQHPVKRGFAQLPPEQHHRAFAQIVEAVHRRGTQLEDIHFVAPGYPVQRLLTTAEVRHLEDVRRLLAMAAWATVLVVPAWLLAALVLARRGLPGRAARITAVALLSGAAIVPLLVWGPKAVFYQLHVALFPADNQWFFYWQESLMSTLMKAPVLFAGIAVEITLLALLLLPLLYCGGLLLARRLLEKK